MSHQHRFRRLSDVAIYCECGEVRGVQQEARPYVPTPYVPVPYPVVPQPRPWWTPWPWYGTTYTVESTGATFDNVVVYNGTEMTVS